MISDVLGYARARMVSLGFVEWADGFNDANIPSVRLSKAFHVSLGLIQGVKNNQADQVVEVPFTIEAFQAPGRDTKARIDRAALLGDNILSDVMASANRLTQSGVKNISFRTMELRPLAESNDNGVILKLEFSALVIISAH